MTKYLLLLLFALIATASLAQGDYQDVVYLKNGSVIRGIIIEQIPNKSIKIETYDSNIFVYKMDEIEKMTKEPYIGITNLSKNESSQQGYMGIVELAYEGGTEYGLDRVKIDIINGFQVNPYISIGLGCGIRDYTNTDIALVPVFGNWKVNFTNNKITPYLSLGIGYSFDATHNFKGVGFMLNSTIGVSFKISDKTALLVGLGCEMQILNFYYDEDMDAYFYSGYRNSSVMSLNVGISF
jgi:hypothetical protein